MFDSSSRQVVREPLHSYVGRLSITINGQRSYQKKSAIGGRSSAVSSPGWKRARVREMRRTRSWLQQIEHFLRRAREHSLLPFHNNGPLHQHRMLQQQIDHRFTRDILACIKTECLKILILPHKIGGEIRKQ
jgi:hypothetical protein